MITHNDLPWDDPPILFEDARILVVEATVQTSPLLVEQLCKSREEHCDGPDFDQWGFDEYDVRAFHVVALARDTAQVVGALRLALGDHLIAQNGVSAFYLHKYWHIDDSGVPFLKNSIEYGRIWVNHHDGDNHNVLRALWNGMASFLADHRKYKTVLGAMGITGIAKEAAVVLANYLYRFALSKQVFLQAYSPLGGHGATDVDRLKINSIKRLSQLVAELRRLDPELTIPPLLLLYVRRRATLLGDVAWMEDARKCIIPLTISSEDFQASARTLRLLPPRDANARVR